ncbi:hypothetical protein Nepgr_016927 [Nepenthes gracilis]|uniref:Myb-like domain-containing protein n=1 Tax=Nepenthes gracilis TaxID=150966 RepID=A0AAD3SR55_NEPGR|nr:hypothetical protein Nepgr_016927 [Nepenthes gracilis]
MALEQLSPSSGSGPVNGDRHAVSISNGGVDGRLEGGDEGSKAPRLPRWTRQEILVLIHGKRVAENRVRRDRTAGLGLGQAEPKWASVSSYCKRHGVNRGPVQCRKRWSNLAGDFKKIKDWESRIKEDSESFWVMRNDLRRERKLPGFFDKEVYDILSGSSISGTAPGLALALAPAVGTTAEEVEGVAEEAEAEAEAEAVFDSGRSAAADDGLFSDFEQSGGQDEIGQSPDKQIPLPEEDFPLPIAFPAPMPISEKQYQQFASVGLTGQGANNNQPPLNAEIGTMPRGQKRKQFATEEDGATPSLQDQLIQALEKNGSILRAQLEAQNTNLKLDREERKEHADSLVAVLNKLADALGRIADKL